MQRQAGRNTRSERIFLNTMSLKWATNMKYFWRIYYDIVTSGQRCRFSMID